MTLLCLKKKAVSPSKPDVNLAITQHPEYPNLIEQGFKLVATHEYTDKNGNNLFYKVRLKNPETGKKWIRPVHFSVNKWVWEEPKIADSQKPLYALHLIGKHLSAKIVFVEGENKADALNKKFAEWNCLTKYVATTSGSATSAGKADCSILSGRSASIWADNDTPGIKFRAEITQKLVEHNCNIEWVDVDALNLPGKGGAVNWLVASPTIGFEQFESMVKTPPPIFDEPIEPLFDIAEASVTDFLMAPPPPRKYLLAQCLPIGKTGVLVGMGGVRKSGLMFQLQISIATGKPLCGNWPIGERGSTLGLYAEEDADELHRRLYFATEGLSKGDKKLIEERVYIKSMSGLDNQIVAKDRSACVCITDFVYRLIQTAKQIPNLKLIILDPASRFRGGDENSSADTTRFVEACEIVAKETGATVLIVHHVNKASMNASEQSQSASRGSSALTDGVRWQMNMSVMSTEEAKKFGVPEKIRKYYVKAEVTKNNYAPPQEGIVWLELTIPHGILKYAELTTVADNKTDELMYKVVKKVEENAVNGIEHSRSGFAKEYHGKSGIFGIGDKGLRGLIDQAIEKGFLVLKAPNKPAKNVDLVLTVPESHKEQKLNCSAKEFDALL